jgi:hypothetical protein
MPHGIWIPNQKLKYQDIWFAVLRRHPKLRSVLSTRNIGYRMTWFESDIMVSILLQMKSRGIVCLPIHDGLICPQSKADQVQQIMSQVTLEKLGFSIPSSVKILEPMKPEALWAVAVDPQISEDLE